MWLDVMTPEEASMSPMLNIKPPPPEPFELRVIIWSVEDVPVMDEVLSMRAPVYTVPFY